MSHGTMRASAILLNFTFIAALVASAAPVRAETTVTDAGGRKVVIGDTSRILSLGGDVTEILYALKADNKIIAVDSTSQFPVEALKQKPNVGYLRALATEGVLSTNPTLIIAGKDAGPPPVVAALKASSIPYVEVPDDHTPEGAAAKIRFVASVIGEQAAGETLAKNVEHDFTELAKQRAKVSKPIRAVFVLTVQNGRATIGGAHTSADAILKLAGAENAAAGAEGFKPMADEAGVELAPEVIITMKHSSSNFRSDAVLGVKGLQSSPAAKNNRVYEMDGLYLLSFGPRTAQAARDLMNLLYPDLAQSQTSSTK
jgi:iron complex transport system substrate-binding protein